MSPLPATLLFAHGGGFCRQIWDPIIRRLERSPVLQQVAADFVTFDFPFHGSKRDESVAPKLQVDGPAGPRVLHPAADLVPWTTAEMQRQVQMVRGRQDGAVIGVGHSMGAGAMWNAEVQDPGTFDALILFEPVYGLDDPEARAKITDFLVDVTLERKSSWTTREEAKTYFDNLKNFSSWDRESLAAYVEGAVVKDEAEGKTVLACHPHIEAALYCHDILCFTDEELKRPKSRIRFHSGERSNMFFTPFFVDAKEKCPEIYSIGEPMKKCTHLLVLEDPETAANKILSDLANTAVFRRDQPSRI
ncbi:unnamed protein product [Phytophthora lilii]|uniref:Unnamed protein product n=1 Tax=Phytophthora lilii TaxID=2077276 RepID=A0A9W7DCL1_9STRA|nr:unnamed protein product [Phytophthora lilii]